MLKTAIVLFVHNEVDNIGWWLSHHRAIGFSTLIVCDDHSTDGTWTVLSNAAAFYDIRLYRSDLAFENRLERQTAFHATVLQAARTEFDWIVALAADEYFHLETAPSLDDFLATTDETTIPVHWCLFGSNGHDAPSPFPPTQAFTRHAPLETADHRVTRFFIRSAQWESGFPDPFSRLTQEADWSKARILHYAAGNRQSFFQRPSSETPEESWAHFDRNNVLDMSPQKWLAQTRQFAASIIQSGLTDLYWQLRQMVIRNDEDELAVLGLSSPDLLESSAFSFPDFKFYALGQTAQLALNFENEEITRLEVEALDSEQYVRLLLAVETSAPAPHPAYLITEQPCGVSSLNIAASPSLLPSIPLRLDIQKQRVFSPLTQQDVPLDLSETPLVLQPSSAELINRITRLRVLCQGGHSLTELLRGIERLPTPDATALGCAIAMLPPEEANRLAHAFPGLVPLNIRPVSP